ncbi:MAG: ATP-binding protein, partial [Telluria sp.]
EFEVSDRGPGLSDADLGVATERFWRRASGWGSGLGLSIVAAITERFGGRLRMSRREGGGLVVTLSLPGQAGADKPLDGA